MCNQKGALIVKRDALARVLGVSVRRVSQLESDRVLQPCLRGKAGRPSLYDLATCVPKYIAFVEQAVDGDRVNIEHERAALLQVQRRRAELDFERARGTLVDLESVVRAGKAHVHGWREKVLGLSSQARTLGIVDHTTEPQLRALCRQILEAIASWTTVADAEGTAARKLKVRAK